MNYFASAYRCVAQPTQEQVLITFLVMLTSL